MTERRYGKTHREARRRWAASVEKGIVTCWRWGLPIESGSAWDLGHDDLGNHVGPEHASCNRKAAGERRQRLYELVPKPLGQEPSFEELPREEQIRRVEEWIRSEAPVPVTLWSRHWSGGFTVACPKCRAKGGPCEVAAGNVA